MIIPKGKQLEPSQIKELENILSEFSCNLQAIEGTTRTIYAILGDERDSLMIKRIEGLSYIFKVDTVQSSYKLMDLKSELANHKIQLGEHSFVDKLLVIAGPCTIDPKNPQYFIETAHAIKEAGAHAIRGGVWKPRTNPYTYQGERKAIEIISQASQETSLPFVTEVMESQHIDIAIENGASVLQIGARNALNYPLLKEVGKKSSNKNISALLKRSIHMGKLDEFICAGEYIASSGNPNVLLCPRGTLPSIDGYRNYPDECITPLLKQKTWAPVVVDPSHSVGKAMYVPYVSLSAVAYGASGLIIETHIEPLRGIGDDPKQAITPKVLQKLIQDAQELYHSRKKYENPKP